MLAQMCIGDRPWFARGISLFVAIVAIFGFGDRDLFLSISCIVGIIHSIEEIAMTFILPEWKHDVWSIFHAISLSKELQQESSVS